MRWIAFWLALGAAAYGAQAPYEVTSDHSEIEASANGGYVVAQEVRYRILTQDGIEKLHERDLSYAEGYQRLTIRAYTLKADGKRIDVPQNNILWGQGQSSQKGFQDRHLVSVFFPNLEVGDSIVLNTVLWQDKPWFDNTFDYVDYVDTSVAQKDVEVTLTVPESMDVHIDVQAMANAGAIRGQGKMRRTWKYTQQEPRFPESDAVDFREYAPHVIFSAFDGYKGLAAAYRARATDKVVPTAPVAALAEKLTADITDPRQQAQILYEWVSTHIAYVGIVLGAGGYIPHPAESVLSNLYGDCKDHAVLLEALLTAKKIPSTAVLIMGGRAVYRLPPVASATNFDHVITYLPQLDLFVDSTAELSPFGTLPDSDAGKEVLRMDTGEVVKTPVNTAAASTLALVGTVRVDAEGTAIGEETVRTTGSPGTELRSILQHIPPDKDNETMRSYFGPGAEGAVDRGTPRVLKDPYVFSAKFRVPFMVAWPGPMALPFRQAFLPLNVFDLVSGRMPNERNTDYVCPSLDVSESVDIVLPDKFQTIHLPPNQTLTAPDMQLQLRFQQRGNTIKRDIRLSINHPEAFCTPHYYESVKPELAKMVRALRQQIILQAAAPSAPATGTAKGKKK